jgi:predicted aminopeptidase
MVGAARSLFVAVLATPLLGGCYAMQAATGQAEVMRRSVPIEAVLADPATDERTRERLELVAQARSFAVAELGLPDSRSYLKLADLGRADAVYNVVATDEFSVEPRQWCFPVAGCVAYRGYFDAERARDYAVKLTARGDDAVVSPAPTYSTLGHLPDPVFKAMLDWREARLVGTIFHELAHEQLYLPGDSAFNEAFASVVEQEGLRRWFEARGVPAQDREALERAAAREREFAALLRATRARLARLYASGVPEADMRIEKQREFGRLKFEYWRMKAAWGGYAGYDAWFDKPLNNARIAAVATYHDCVPGLRAELDRAGSLPAFYARAAEIAAWPAARRRALCVKGTAATEANATRD